MIKVEDSGNIKVADVSIAQLSRGLYRSTGAAFKELVSNAWDADAAAIRIDTNYPEFDFISCVDNGTGMSLKQFLNYFSEEGIGYCFKRKYNKDTTDKYKRPIIGRLGIGMLAVGQLCHSFEIESHYVDEKGKGAAYHAEIILLEEGIPDIENTIRSEDIERRSLDVGRWIYHIIPYDESKNGFRVYSADVRDTFRGEMKSSIGTDTKKTLSFNFSDLHEKFYNKIDKSIRECKPYLETIWELSILCPLPYNDDDKYPINLTQFEDTGRTEELKQSINMLKKRQADFKKWHFRVFFDGMELKRLIQFPTNEDVIPRVYYINFDQTVAANPLRFSGYVFGQASRAIKPLELNGIQIRIRGVGIGGYDSTFFKYYKEIETIRSRWVSGEIFVDNGLEMGLNIDRDSFNEHDEHFKKLQFQLHEKLDSIFNDINNIARAKQEFKRNIKDEYLQKSMQAIVAKQSHGKYKLVQRNLGDKKPVVTIDEKKGEVILNIDSRPLKKKKADMIFKHVILAYYISRQIARTKQEQNTMFYNLLKAIVGKLI